MNKSEKSLFIKMLIVLLSVLTIILVVKYLPHILEVTV